MTKEKNKMKNDLEILETKFKDLNLEKKLQNEELQKVNREKTAVDSQKKESEKLLIQEKAKVANLEKEVLKSKEEMQSKNVLLDEFKLSMREDLVNYLFSKFKFACIFHIYITIFDFPASKSKLNSIN